MELTKTLDQTQEKVLLSCVLRLAVTPTCECVFLCFLLRLSPMIVKVREKENYISQIVGERNELKRTLDQ